MNRKHFALALVSALSFLSTVELAVADVDSTGFEGTRAWLREHCAKIHGEIIETKKKTTCITVAGVEIVCRHNNHCSRNRHVFEKVEESGGAGSLSEPLLGTFYEPPKGDGAGIL